MGVKLCFRLSLCVFALLIFNLFSNTKSQNLDSTENASLNPSLIVSPNPVESSECAFNCKEFKALQEELRELKKSHVELMEKFGSLSKTVDELKEDISEDGGGIGMMRLPLRGPPGKQGEKGEKGENGQPGPKGDQGPIDPRSLTSCSDAVHVLPSSRSKKQTVHPHGNATKIEVLCDFETDGGRWTVIQKRSSGPKQEFNKTWNEYEKGFGSLDGNFWLGLENIRALTKNGDQELRIELEDWEGEKRWAKYSSFSISDASDFYRLEISGFSGDATDSLINSGYSTNYGMRFTTKDKDNDGLSGVNCPVTYGGYGGWWFNSCGGSGLNGLYFEKGETVPGWQGVRWYAWKGDSYSLAKSEMKIRKRK